MRKYVLLLLINVLFLQKEIVAQKSMIKEKWTLKIAIPFNNCVSDSTLKAGPGFSAWIEFNGKIIVFDTGSNYQMLLENMMQMGLNFKQVTDIFISHNHWDHLYGIPGVAGVQNFQLTTFIPKSSVEKIIEQVPRLTYTEVDSFKELYPGIWTTGELRSDYKNTSIAEQALILEQEDGLVVVTGCSHPGIEKMVKHINEHFPEKKINLLLGGFHLQGKSLEEIRLISENLKKLGVNKIAPSHCTGDEAIELFKKDWGENFIQLNLGDIYTVN